MPCWLHHATPPIFRTLLPRYGSLPTLRRDVPPSAKCFLYVWVARAGCWIALVTAEIFQNTKIKRFSFKTLSTKKYSPISFSVIAAFWTLPCLDATYGLLVITIWARHNSPETVPLFSIDAVGWNNYAREYLVTGSTYLCHLIITASHPPLQSSPPRIDVR